MKGNWNWMIKVNPLHTIYIMKKPLREYNLNDLEPLAKNFDNESSMLYLSMADI